jgi:tetraacyldisaccharide 4'-kinase
MRAPAFWWRERPTLIARLLRPLGRVYGAATLWRMRRRGTRIGIPVICVGNFVAGGAGKTPTTLALLRVLKDMGQAPFALTRGYGGTSAGPVMVDAARHSPAEVGDEALLLAAQAPAVVSRKRAAGGRLAQDQGAGIVVMDDGLQNPGLARDLRLAVVDGASGIGNGLCLPAGPLRAPLEGQLGECDAVIVIGPGEAGERVADMARQTGVAVLKAQLDTSVASRVRLNGRSVIAVSGIGRPAKFDATLLAAGAGIAAHRAFPDHHAYTDADVATLLAEAKAQNRPIATTEKDWTKLAALWPAAERERVIVVAVTLVFEAPSALSALLGRTVAAARAGSGPAGAP